MEFFDHLLEPYRSDAIASYNEKFSNKIPKNISEAIQFGFNTSYHKNGNQYWIETMVNPEFYTWKS
jgi:hypothetical protein